MAEDIGKIIWSTSLAKIASIAVVIIFALYCLYSGFIYIFFQHRYRGIRFTTKNITYIAMLSAASVSITIVVSYFAPITVLPPIRIAFEGLMIKITGLIFGPVVGVMAGFITDSLCILFIPSYFHIAYTITITSYGLIGGLTYVLNYWVKDKKFIMYIISSIAIIIFITFFTFFANYYPVSPSSGDELFKSHIPLNKYFITLIIILSGFVTFIFQSVMFIIYLLYKQKSLNNYKRTGVYKERFIDDNIIPVMFMAVMTEYYLSALIAPWGDSSLFGSNSSQGHSTYPMLLVYRIAEAPVKIFFNTAVIYITYKTVSPLINRDY